jgi:Protein of unknown function (DUF4239)
MLSASLTRPILNFMPDAHGFLGRVFLCLTFLGILLVAAGLAVAGRMLAERFFAPYRVSENSREIAVVAAMVLTLFALLLAFAIVTLYDQRRDAETAVAREGSDLAMIARDSRALAKANAAGDDESVPAFYDNAYKYIAFVVIEEFPAMYDGREVPEASRTCVTNLFSALWNANPTAPAAAPFHDAAVRQANDLVAQRHARLTGIDAALPSAFVFLLFVAGGIAVGLMCFVKASDAWVERGLVVSVAVVITSGMLAAFVLEFPFSGPLAISPDPIVKGFLTNLDVPDAILPEFPKDPSCVVA